MHASLIPRLNLICAYIDQPLVVAASNGVAALLSWLIYKFSDTIEQRMIPGGSNNGQPTNVDTNICDVCNT